VSGDTILTVDQGTTNTKALLLDRWGHIVALGSAPVGIAHPQPGWVEQSPQDIWASVVKAVEVCLAQAPQAEIHAIGISNQRESVVCWDPQTSEPLGPAVTWQCRRTTVETERLKAEGHSARVLAKTGLPLDPLFPSTKIRWLIDLAGTRKRRIGTVDSWLIWNLTDGQTFATDRSNASRTQLLDVQSGQWDEELCTLFGVDADVLPKVTDSSHIFGYTRNVPGIPDGIPIASAIGDSHAALFGHAAFAPGDAKATFGTGSSVMMVSPEFKVPTDGMTTTIAWSIDGRITHALEGNVLVSASLFPWVATLLGLDGDVDGLMELAASVDDSNGVSVVPALVGLGAPHWNPLARGIVCGLSFASTRAHLAHAAALSLPLQAIDVFEAMRRQSSSAVGQVFVDGGPTRNAVLMKYLADLLGQQITVCKDPELSALGAGMLAGLSIGFWSSLEEIAGLEREREAIEPSMPEAKRLSILNTWKSAVAHCLASPDGHE
jgi:glycerol kinase